MRGTDRICIKDTDGRTEMIEFKNVTRVFKTGFMKKEVFALRDLNLTVKRGDVFGFIGPNGAGKTTAIKILAGLIFPTSGEVLIDGVSSKKSCSRKNLGFLPESPHFYEYLSAFEFMKLSASLLTSEHSEALSDEHIHESLKRVGLEDATHKRIRKFSLGMVQRLGIAQAMLGDPEVLVLDEPLSSLDPFGRRDVRQILENLKEQGKTIFFSSHIIHDVEKIATRVAIIKNGSVIIEGKLSELTGDSDLEEFFVNEAN